MKRVLLAAQSIEEYIARAGQGTKSIPSERQLAEELGISRTTIRAAMQQLVDKGLLVRRENKRLEVVRSAGEPANLDIGFVAPAGPSGDVGEWWTSMKGVLQGQPARIHFIAYEHWEDACIQEALSKLHGLFFIAPAAKLSPLLVRRMKSSTCRVVVLDQDESDAGLPSVTLFPPATEHKLFDHLYRLGHRRIDCINTQEEGVIIQGRISGWRQYIVSHKMGGRLHSLERYKPTESAYQLIRDALREGQSIAPALFCTTGPAAMGAMRALYEAGLKIGTDVSVCAINGEGFSRYLMPTLTTLESPPRAHYLQRVTQWLLGTEEWQGPLLTQPEEVTLFEGESTGPAPTASFSSVYFGLAQEESSSSNTKQTTRKTTNPL